MSKVKKELSELFNELKDHLLILRDTIISVGEGKDYQLKKIPSILRLLVADEMAWPKKNGLLGYLSENIEIKIKWHEESLILDEFLKRRMIQKNDGGKEVSWTIGEVIRQWSQSDGGAHASPERNQLQYTLKSIFQLSKTEKTDLEKGLMLNIAAAVLDFGQILVSSLEKKIKISIKERTSITILEEDILKEKVETEIELTIGSGAQVTYITQNKNNKIKRTATVHADAKIIWFDINKNKTVESEIITKLIEPGARTETYGIFYGENDDQFTISHRTEHLAPNTHSIMETKGVLDDKSRASIRSLIKIYPGMSGCTGHERADTLLLSKNAHIDAIPELEIGNNDVQCTHAVTTTRLSPEKLFYLEGRGLDEGRAKKMLVEAHLESIFEKIPSFNMV